MANLYLLIDYRGAFGSSTRARGASLNIDLLKQFFSELNYELVVRHFWEIDFRNGDYRGVPFLYHSPEDPGLLYKDYIEDVLLGLMLRGAKLVPDFAKFRAHDNKVFMEILRDCTISDEVRSLRARTFGSYEDFLHANIAGAEALVMKPSEGTRSAGVRVREGRRRQLAYVRRISRSPTLLNAKLWWRSMAAGGSYVRMSTNRRKFIVQELVPKLPGDFKITVCGKKYYVVQRRNRPDDFRASGSGLLSFPDAVPSVVLDFAEKAFNAFDVPFAAFDIAFNGDRCFLFEFQFVSLSQFGVEKAPHYFRRDNGNWTLVKESSIGERNLAECVAEYLEISNHCDALDRAVAR